MAKLMAPNIRIDWYPEGHFADPENPTLGELNSGYNLSPAIVTGYTLDFTDTDTVDAATIYDNQTSELFTHSSYEANLQFFLAPRGTSSANEGSYRMAEELFYHNQFSKGYLVKRFGYKWNVDYKLGQKIDIFYVQTTIPKVSVEEGKPILLEVTYIPLGLGVSRGWAGQIKFSWLGEPHSSPSVKIVDGEVVAQNHVPNPRFENGLSHWSPASVIASNVAVVDADSVFVGPNAWPDAEFTPQGIWAPDNYWVPLGNGVLEARGRWAGENDYSFNIAASSVSVTRNETVRLAFSTHVVAGHVYLPPTLMVQELGDSSQVLAEREVVTATSATWYEQDFTPTTSGVVAIRVGFRTDPRKTFSTRSHISGVQVLRGIEGEDKHLEVLVPADRTANNDIDMGNMDVAVGQWVAISGYAAQTGVAGTFQYQYRVARDSGGWSYPHTPITAIGDGVRFTEVHQIPPESDGGYMNLRVSFRDQTSELNVMFGTRFMIAIADSEQEALRQVETYFDGDSIYNG